jgi:glycosyltransferase involved in cell wall biosynthesis
MHIVLVNSEYPSLSGQGQGGIATYTYTMADALRSQGHTVHILLRQGVSEDQIPGNCIPAFYTYEPPAGFVKRIQHRFQNDPMHWEEGHTRGLRSKLLKIHAQDKIDIVEIPEFGGAGAACTKPLPFPVVINFHMSSALVDEINGTKPDKNRLTQYSYEEKTVHNASGYRSPSEAILNDVSKRYTIDHKKITVIPNPVSSKPFDAIEKYHTGDLRFHILFTGRLERRKGAELLLKGIKEILTIDDTIHITIAGETESNGTDGYRKAIERVLNQQQRQRIWFLGPVDRSKLFILYCRSSILLAPSLFENAPYSILEAMSAGLPIVASSGGGIPEIITHNTSGLLFENENIDSMVECIRKLYTEREFGALLAENAYNRIKTPIHQKSSQKKLFHFMNQLSISNENCIHIK